MYACHGSHCTALLKVLQQIVIWHAKLQPMAFRYFMYRQYCWQLGTQVLLLLPLIF